MAVEEPGRPSTRRAGDKKCGSPDPHLVLPGNVKPTENCGTVRVLLSGSKGSSRVKELHSNGFSADPRSEPLGENR